MVSTSCGRRPVPRTVGKQLKTMNLMEIRERRYAISSIKLFSTLVVWSPCCITFIVRLVGLNDTNEIRFDFDGECLSLPNEQVFSHCVHII